MKKKKRKKENLNKKKQSTDMERDARGDTSHRSYMSFFK